MKDEIEQEKSKFSQQLTSLQSNDSEKDKTIMNLNETISEKEKDI